MFQAFRVTLGSYLSSQALPDFANRMAEPEPCRDRPRCLLGVLLFLLIACVVPRAVMAWRLNEICTDGVLYFRLAEELDKGQFDTTATNDLQFGTYPVALAGLHRLGFEWEAAAKVYGVLVSTLTVLPLFGWIRRQFDDRVAFFASLFYAAHPKLIEWSPEAVRDPAFWFFFVLSLYFLWRATTEVDWRFYAAGGVAAAMSCLTRFEGCFLVFPLVGWTCLRFYWLHSGRARLASGFLLAVVAFPAVFLGFRQMLPGHVEGSGVRVAPLVRATDWLMAKPSPLLASAAPPAAPVAAPEAAVALAATPAAWTSRDTLLSFLRTLERGLTPLFAVFMFIGYFTRLRLFHRSDNLPLLLIVLAVAGGIWIHIAHAHLASSRYALTIVLLSTRNAAIGLLEFSRFAGAWLARRSPRFSVQGALVVSLVVMLLVGSVDALSSNLKSRSDLAQLGRWIRGHCGDSCVLVGSESQLELIGYYAHAKPVSFPPATSGAALAAWIEQIKPDAVVISKRRQGPTEYQAILDQHQRLGLEPIDAALIPGGAKNVLVLARPRPPADHQATRVANDIPTDR